MGLEIALSIRNTHENSVRPREMNMIKDDQGRYRVEGDFSLLMKLNDLFKAG